MSTIFVNKREKRNQFVVYDIRLRDMRFQERLTNKDAMNKFSSNPYLSIYTTEMKKRVTEGEKA
jgi:hypothetical protein